MPRDKVAIFTKNGAIILTVMQRGHSLRTADQVDGIYVLRQDMSVPTSSHLCAIQSHQIPLPSTEHLDELYSGYTVPGLHWLEDTPNLADHTCLKTVISDSVLLPEPPCHTLVTCSKHCHHPTRNNEYSDLLRASHARVYTSYKIESHACQ